MATKVVHAQAGTLRTFCGRYIRTWTKVDHPDSPMVTCKTCQTSAKFWGARKG
jgi:hypothetical protein